MFVNGKEIHKFKAKDSEIVATPLCLGNISKNFSVNNMKKTGLNGYDYDFSIGYDATTSQVFSEKKWDSIKCLDLLRKCFFQQLCVLVEIHQM